MVKEVQECVRALDNRFGTLPTMDDETLRQLRKFSESVLTFGAKRLHSYFRCPRALEHAHGSAKFWNTTSVRSRVKRAFHGLGSSTPPPRLEACYLEVKTAFQALEVSRPTSYAPYFAEACLLVLSSTLQTVTIPPQRHHEVGLLLSHRHRTT